MNSMEHMMKSRIRVLAENRRRYLFNLAVFVVISGVIAVFSGFLSYISLHLPPATTAFVSGVWVASSVFIANA